MSEKYVKLADVEAMLRMEDWPGTTFDDLADLPAVDLAERDALWREYVYVRHVKVPATADEMKAARSAILAAGVDVDG